MSGPVMTLAVFDDGGRLALCAAGDFISAFDSGDSFVAKWACPDTTPPVLDVPWSVSVHEDLGNGPGEVVTFSVTATDDRDPAPDVVCVPPSGSFFPHGTTIVSCTATDDAGNESTCLFPVKVRTKVSRF